MEQAHTLRPQLQKHGDHHGLASVGRRRLTDHQNAMRRIDLHTAKVSRRSGGMCDAQHTHQQWSVHRLRCAAEVPSTRSVHSS
jgi:hypothetical protein